MIEKKINLERIRLFLGDNMDYWHYDEFSHGANLIYADMIYTNLDLSWIDRYWKFLAKDSIFIVQTDYHSAAQVKLKLDSLGIFIAEVIMLQEWGGVPRKGFPIKHDNIYIYANGDDWTWHGDRIQIPKKTANTAFDKKGTGLKTPCSVFYDLGNFSTMSKERVKNPETGKNMQWQKSLKLMRRLMFPFLDVGDTVVSPFMGTATEGVVCQENGWIFCGIENDEKVFDVAKERLLGE